MERALSIGALIAGFRRLAIAGLLVLLPGGCGGPAPVQLLVPPGCELLEAEPNPEVVTSAALRAAIGESGLPWRLLHTQSGIELLLVPAGVHSRGAAIEDGEAADNERPAHPVHVDQPYYLGRSEVTQGQWRRVLGDAPSFFPGADELPVEQVDRQAVQAFLAAAGLELPTEAQWEVACRAGSEGARHGPLDEVAWTRSNAGGRTHPAGQLAPNDLGFVDMLGNVAEWTADAYREDAYGRLPERVVASRRERLGTTLVLRGGSWYDGPRRARASARSFAAMDYRGSHVGLRALLLPKAGPGR